MLIKKIAVIGVESSGKSTLCENLSAHYETVFAKEFARDYLRQKKLNYDEGDLLNIALGQMNNERKALEHTNGILFCDTDISNIQIWSEFKYGRCCLPLLNLAAQQDYDGYILTGYSDIWEYDELRENPDAGIRHQLYRTYLEMAQSYDKPLFVLPTKYEWQDALQWINELLLT